MKKNIIFIGTNGAGKTTLANEMYRKGYHYFKLSPLAEYNTVAELLTLDSNGVVFDRWSVIDLMVYRNDKVMFNNLKHRVDEFNKHNLVVFLHQGLSIFDGKYSSNDGETRVVHRPELESAHMIDREYDRIYSLLRNIGVNIIKLQARGDLESMSNFIIQEVEKGE